MGKYRKDIVMYFYFIQLPNEEDYARKVSSNSGFRLKLGVP